MKLLRVYAFISTTHARIYAFMDSNHDGQSHFGATSKYENQHVDNWHEHDTQILARPIVLRHGESLSHQHNMNITHDLATCAACTSSKVTCPPNGSCNMAAIAVEMPRIIISLLTTTANLISLNPASAHVRRGLQTPQKSPAC